MFVKAMQFLEKAAQLQRYFDRIGVSTLGFQNRKYDCNAYISVFPIKLFSTLITFSLDDQPVYLHNQNYLSVGEPMLADLGSTPLFLHVVFIVPHPLESIRRQVHEHVRATRPDSSG